MIKIKIVKNDSDISVIIGLALVVCFLLSVAFLGNDLVLIKLGSEPLFSEPGYMEIYRVYLSKTYDLYMISNTLPGYIIDVRNMPAATYPFSDINQHPALMILSHHLVDLFNMLAQLDISFENRMQAPETPRDELEINKLKAVLNLIYKIQAILIYYVPTLPRLDLTRYT